MDADGGFVAFGVLLGREHVLTCASGLRADAELAVGFGPPSVDGPGQLRVAHVVAEADLALLRLVEAEESDPGTRLQLDALASSNRWSVALSGVWVRVRRVATDGGWCLLYLDVEELEVPFDIPADVSGAPVVDDPTGDVVGVVVSRAESGAFVMAGVNDILTRLPETARWAPSPLPALVLGTAGPLGAPTMPLGMVIHAPEVPESERVCPECGSELGRTSDRGPGRSQGFCPHCGTPFSFLPELRAGDVVAERYKMAGCLARGGLGWLYLAEDLRQQGTYVVLKGRLNSRDPHARALFRSESGFLARLDHPGIVKTSGIVTDEHGEYIVMEYVPGPSLREAIRRAPMIRYVIAIGLQILDALDYLHGQGLLYCDMKPENVILSGDRVKVIDLGAVRRADDRESPIVYTPEYRAPESRSGDRGPTVRSDVYSVGRVLADLVELAESDDEFHERETRSSWLGPRSLRRVIERATAEYDQRFATAAEMAEQLEGVLREVLSHQFRSEHPGCSLYFTQPGQPLDAGLGQAPPLEYWIKGTGGEMFRPLPTPTAIAASLPEPRPYAERAFGEAAPALRACRDLIGAGDLIGAARSLATAEGMDAGTWGLAWHHGLLALARNDVTAAEAEFDRVYAALPGEAAPKLALALCAEHMGSLETAESYHAAVAYRDHSWVAAAFGLARRFLIGQGLRAPAVEALDRAASAQADGGTAAVAAIRALCAAPPQYIASPPTLDELGQAVRRMAALPPAPDAEEGRARDRLRAEVWQAVYDGLHRSAPGTSLDVTPLVAGPVDVDAARRLMADALHAVVGQARTADERRALARRVGEITGRRWSRQPRETASAELDFTLTVSQEPAMVSGATEMHAVLRIRRSVRGGEVAPWIRVSPSRFARVKFLREIAPFARDLTSHAVQSGERTLDVPLRAWEQAEDTSRDLHLCLAVDQADSPRGVDLQAARVEVVAATDADPADSMVRVPLSAPAPVLVHLLGEAPADRVRLERAIAAGLDAWRRGQDSQFAELALAHSLARDLGDGAVVRLLDAVWASVPAHMATHHPASVSHVSQVSRVSRMGHRRGHSAHSRLSVVSTMSRPSVPGRRRRWHGPPMRPFCIECRYVLGAGDRVCPRCLTPVDSAEPSRQPAQVAPSEDRCPACRWPVEPGDRWCTACGGDIGAGGARIWCPSDDPARVGRTTPVAFAMAGPGGRRGMEAAQPLPDPVKVRVVLEAWDASVIPITQVALLRTDRTIDELVFDVVPAHEGELTLTFRLYMEAGGHLLQEIEAKLPVESAENAHDAAWEGDEVR